MAKKKGKGETSLRKATRVGKSLKRHPSKTVLQKRSLAAREKERKWLRIALFSWESRYSITVGAMSTWVSELAQALGSRGHEVHVFTRRNNGQFLDDCIDGVHYHRCSGASGCFSIDDMFGMCRSLVSRFFEIQDSSGLFDVVHGHDWLTANAISWIKRSQTIKAIITIYSTEYQRCGNEFHEGESQRIREYERQGIHSADKVITISQRLKQELAWLYDAPDQKVSVVYNGIHPHPYKNSTDPGDVKVRYGIGVLDPTALFVGEMAPQYGPDIIIHASPHILFKYPAAKFIFVGQGGLLEDIQNEGHRMSLSHSTRFLAHVEKEELVDILKSCDVVLVPSRNEFSYGIVLEAWSSGKPVIVTHNGPSEFVWHEVTGLKIYDDPGSLAWGIERVFSNHEFGRWMGRNGQVAAETCFSWNVVANQVEKVYRS